MSAGDLKLAIIAGEVSGDLLGADLVKALRPLVGGDRSVVGVGGEGLEAEGLKSLFDYSELSIMGISQVLAKLPKLILRIRQTAQAIIAARPDILVIIDSPDFTHRVAQALSASRCRICRSSTMSARASGRGSPSARVNMRPYVDHVLAVLPFEPEVMEHLGGPPTTYVGHRLASDANVLAVRARQIEKTQRKDGYDASHLPFAAGIARQRNHPSVARFRRDGQGTAQPPSGTCGSCCRPFRDRKVWCGRSRRRGPSSRKSPSDLPRSGRLSPRPTLQSPRPAPSFSNWRWPAYR